VVIVFEGIDKSGKTTLANILSKELDIPVLRVFKNNSAKIMNIVDSYGCKSNDFFEDIVIMDIILQTGMDVILDRSLPSADCYRRIRGERSIDMEIIRWWRNSLVNVGGVYVWVKASHSFVTSAFHTEKMKMRYTKKNYIRLDDLFHYHYTIAMHDVKCIRILNSQPEFNDDVCIQSHIKNIRDCIGK
jgi:thymidylate kinase